MEGPENTLPAFRKAIDSGMNLLECDVQLSKDGVVVIAHDATLDRMCGSEFNGKHVKDYNFEDLPKFQRKIRFHLNEGFYELSDSEEGKFSTLRELFEMADNVYISIDLKDSSVEMVTKVLALIKEFKREDKTIIGSMFKEQHNLVQRLNRDVTTFYSGA